MLLQTISKIFTQICIIFFHETTANYTHNYVKMVQSKHRPKSNWESDILKAAVPKWCSSKFTELKHFCKEEQGKKSEGATQINLQLYLH